MIRIKICGLVHPEDAELAADLGADLLGFVFEPSSPRCVGDLDWGPAWLSRLQPPKVAVFGAVGGWPPIVFDRIQAHSWTTSAPDNRPRLLVVRMGAPDEVWPDPARIRPGDAILLDAYTPEAHGGTGRTADWDRAEDAVRRMPQATIFLAGGLTPDNVVEAVAKVRPAGVDVSSGVERSPGRKDSSKLRDFFQVLGQFRT